MAYISDRQRVELALPARLLWSVIQCGYENGITAHDILSQIQTACMEPLDGLLPKEKLRLARRIDRVFSEVIDPLVSKGENTVTAGKAGLVIYYFIVDLVDQGILELYSDTPMANAIEMMLPELTPLIEIKGVDRSAQKQATKLITRLREMGYYGSLRLSQ
jgi:hypothetical protein